MLAQIWISVLLIPWLFAVKVPWLGEDNSDLAHLADDFQILARITNAIALQTASIQKTIKARQVIVELLQVNIDDFAEILKIDEAGSISVLKDLQESIAKIPKTAFTSDLNLFKDSLNEVNGAMQAPDLPLDDIEKRLNGNLTELKANQTVFVHKCKTDNLEIVTGLATSGLFNANRPPKDGEDRTEWEKTRAEHTKKLKGLKKRMDSFITCISSLNEYSQNLQDLPVWSVIEDHKKAFEMISSLMKPLEIVTEGTAKLKTELDESSSSWQKNNELKGSFGKQIDHLSSTHITVKERYDIQMGSYSIAFFGAEDLLRVFDDLKSPWFKKHFARGASTEKLENSLKPFQQISEKIIDLESKWKNFYETNVTNHHPLTLKSVSKSMSTIEDFIQNPGFSEPVDQFVRLLTDTLKECVIAPHTTINETLHDYQKPDAPTNTVINAMSHLNQIINETILFQDLNNTAKYVQCLEKFNESIPSVTIKEDNVYSITQSLKEEFFTCSEKKVQIPDFLFKFRRIMEFVEEVEVAFSGFVPGTAAITLKSLAEKAKSLQSVQCLRNKKFDAPNLLKMIDFVSSLRDFPSSDMIDYTVDYLKKITEIKSVLKIAEDEIHHSGKRSTRATIPDPILPLNNSKILSQTMGESTYAIWNLIGVRMVRTDLNKVGDHFDQKIVGIMEHEGISGQFLNPKPHIQNLLTQADDFDKQAKKLRPQSLANSSAIFHTMSNLYGVQGNRRKVSLLEAKHSKQPEFVDVVKEWDTLAKINLDFTIYKQSLKAADGAIFALQDYYDRLFGHVKKQETKTVVIEKTSHMSWVIIISAVIGIVLLIIIISLVSYGLTKDGKEKYINLYLYYFGKPADFEKRWRYSLFIDREDGTNALLNTVRELNVDTMKQVLKRGPYINAYSQYGSTSLHATVKFGTDKMLELLIKSGIDRTLLDVKNRTAEQWIPTDLTKVAPTQAERYKKISKMFKKHQKKKYRIRVPPKFPSSKFHMFAHRNCDTPLVNDFMERFQGISANDGIPTSTHFIVATDANGVFETDHYGALGWILNGLITVTEPFMKDCLEDKKVLEQDSKYLVTKIKFDGILYDTLLQWSMSKAKGEIPYLYGVIMTIIVTDKENHGYISSVADAQGAIVATETVDLSKYNMKARPYLHSHLGPFFIVHDGTIDVSVHKKDKVFTVFTINEFYHFMLKRDIHRDTDPNPASIALEEVELDS